MQDGYKIQPQIVLVHGGLLLVHGLLVSLTGLAVGMYVNQLSKLNASNFVLSC